MPNFFLVVGSQFWIVKSTSWLMKSLSDIPLSHPTCEVRTSLSDRPPMKVSFTTKAAIWRTKSKQNGNQKKVKAVFHHFRLHIHVYCVLCMCVYIHTYHTIPYHTIPYHTITSPHITSHHITSHYITYIHIYIYTYIYIYYTHPAQIFSDSPFQPFSI